MSMWRCDLTDSRSIRIRFALFLLQSIPTLVIVWLITRSSLLLLVLSGASCYLSVLEFFLDHWRLKHSDASARELFRFRLPWVILLVGCVPVLILLLT